ncbi:hypothetical protein MKW98_007979 [Papaver atlanticum]|uniref:Uncharacterized protein n=1 Tax=Papaver atlanticum TaxID=357466 RepID=A0AAD4S6T9_9MAGN|nr:hypothetical protein MKW98_007979 [Papaver atlanticum]
MRPTRLDFVHEEQVIATQASIADNQVQGYEDDQVKLPNVNTNECHPDDRPDFLFKEYQDEDEEEGEDNSEDESEDEDETQEKYNYEDWVSMCARGIDVGNDPGDCNEDFNIGGYYEEQQIVPVNATSDEEVPRYEPTQEEETKWQEDFGQHLKEPKRQEMINEDVPEVEPGEISTSMDF